MSIGRLVRMPCPTSGFLAMMMTLPSGRMRMNAFGDKGRRRGRAGLGLGFERRRQVEADEQAAAGGGGDLEERAAIAAGRA